MMKYEKKGLKKQRYEELLRDKTFALLIQMEKRKEMFDKKYY